MDQLSSFRRKIDECDDIIIKAFEKRMEAVVEILALKKELGLPIFDKNRESLVMEKVARNLQNTVYQEEAQGLFREIIRISRKMQSKMLFPNNLVLIGFMGTGKTSVGKELSKGLEMDFIDVDQLIEIRIGRSITEFFQVEGEAAFRKLEKDVVKEVSSLSNTIISCGGGVVLDPDNITNLKVSGKILLLQGNPETIFNRLKGDNSRPLLKDNMGIDGINRLLQQRRELYENAADVIINTEDKTPDQLSSEIIKRLLG